MAHESVQGVTASFRCPVIREPFLICASTTFRYWRRATLRRSLTLAGHDEAGTVAFERMSFWDRNVVEPGKQPLLCLFVAFIGTWLLVRAVTRAIRSNAGPLRNVSAGGVHIHHSIPGIILLTSGAVAAVGLPPHRPWRELAAIAIGVGASLVFDEFAMILHLNDDYWTAEGRQSVEAVGLVAACLGLCLVGFIPFGVDDAGKSEIRFRFAAVGLIALSFVATSVCAFKGKFRLGLISIFVWPVAIVGAIRLARTGSRRDRRYYERAPDKRAKAAARTTANDRRWSPRWRRVSDIIAGSPEHP